MAPILVMFLFAGLLWLLRHSQPMARPHSVRCAYFVEGPITNSLPKPQRSKSQVHNCSLNQSANFVVSVLQTVGLGSFIHKDRLSMACMWSHVKYYSVLEKIPLESEKIRSTVGLWFTFTLSQVQFIPFVQPLWVSLCFCGSAGGTGHTASVPALYPSGFPPQFDNISPQSLFMNFSQLLRDRGRQCGRSSVTLKNRQD